MIIIFLCIFGVDGETAIRNHSDLLEMPPQSRIAGGEKVEQQEMVPYQVSIRYEANRHRCGGAILTDILVLTAAHCCSEEQIPLKIVVGNLNIYVPDQSTRIREIQQIVLHDEYNSTLLRNDIAILKIASLGAFDEFVNKIEIIHVTPAVGTICVISGWGTTEFSEKVSMHLLSAAVPIVEFKECNDAYHNVLCERNLCAGYFGDIVKDACAGDSGGPLVCDGKLAGIVSFGSVCRRPNRPGGYVDITQYKSWLNRELTFYDSSADCWTIVHYYVRCVYVAAYFIFVRIFQ